MAEIDLHFSGNILHFVPDDKFIDMALREFEAVAPGRHLPVMLGQSRELSHLKTTLPVFLSKNEASNLIASPECRGIIFHSMQDEFIPILRRAPPFKPKIWIGWGADYYQRLLRHSFPNGLIQSDTRKLIQRSPEVLKRKTLGARWERWSKKLAHPAELFLTPAFSKVDYFIPVLDTEYYRAKHTNPRFTAKYVTWNYGTVEDDLLPDELPRSVIGDDILLGNSATPENNHLEAFEIIDRFFDIGNRKIIAPLSYGSTWYRDQIVCAGRHRFGDRFMPLTEFMPPMQYFKLIDRCGFVFMNHIRQQALGNICTMLLKGARVHLNEESPLTPWLAQHGVVAETLPKMFESDDAKRQLLPLSPSQRAKNIAAVTAHWGRNTQRLKTKALVDIALGLGDPSTAQATS